MFPGVEKLVPVRSWEPDLQQEHCWNWKGTKHGKELESRMGMTKLYLRSKVYTHEASKEPAFMYAMLMPTVHYYL